MSALFSGPPSIPTPIVPAPAPQKSDAEVLADTSAARARLAALAVEFFAVEREMKFASRKIFRW